MKKQEWQYGLHAVQAMLKTDPVRILEIKVQRNRDDERISKVKQQAEKFGIPVSWAQGKELDKLAEAGRHRACQPRWHGRTRVRRSKEQGR